MTSNSLVNVYVNVGLARPISVFVGMPEGYLYAAMSQIKAKRIPFSSDTGTNMIQRIRFLLPDGKGLEVAISIPQRPPRSKPSSLHISSITVGEEAKGFDDWQNQHTQSVVRLPIIEYRKKQDTQNLERTSQ